MCYRKFLFQLAFILLPFYAHAQFIFQNLGEADGLNSKDVLCLYKDREGFLWIGTAHGLNRYDGNMVRSYENPGNRKNLHINSIHPIDTNENLLIATSVGLMVFNKSKGAYQQDRRFSNLANKRILSIKKDGYDRFWIICYSEIYLFDGKKLSRLEDVIPKAKAILRQSFPFTPASAFCWDSSRKGFWIGGYQCFFIDCEKNMVYDSTHNPFNYPILHKKFVTSIALDSNHNLWYASTSDFSINYWNSSVNKVVSYRELEGKKATDGCNYLFVDKKNRLFISTWLFAAYFKEEGKPIKKIPYSQDSPNSIAYGYIQHMIEDSDGNVWFATINGVSKLAETTPFQAIYRLPNFAYFLETNFAHANNIVVDQDRIIAAKDDGIVMYNMNSRSYERYAVSEKTLAKNAFGMVTKAGKNWWFTGADGVFYMEEGQKILKKFDRVPSLYANFIFADNRGKIWFQIVGNAIYRYDPVTKALDRFDGKDERLGLFDYSNCQSFLKLRNGDLLFAMKGTGFLKFHEQQERFSIIPVPNPNAFNVRQSVQDQDGNILAPIPGRGIFKIDQKGILLDSLHTQNGLFSDMFNSIAIDARGAIWVAGSGGLAFYLPKTKQVTRVQINLGKTLQDYWNYVYATKDRIYAVMIDHVIEIDPLKFTKLPVKRPPHITSVKILGKEISDIGRSLQLKPDENYITFQYASLNHRDIPSLQYSYRFEDIDADWVNTGRVTTANYNGLEPGHYTFKVRSTDERGLWMKEVASINIHVLPHWWQTWWFLLIAGAISAAFLDLTYRGYLSRKQKAAFDRTIAYFANSVYGENSVNEICWDIARNCISQLHFEDCVVYLWDPKKNKLVQKAAYGTKSIHEHEIVNPIELEMGEGIVGSAAAEKQTLIIGDTRKDSRYIIDDADRLSEIAVPILHEGKVIGVVDSEHSKKNFFNEAHAQALFTIAAISANKIAEAQAEEQALQKEMMLLEINKMLAESQLVALRAQMNPHFVFNCLNSIQECIVTEKYGEASKYLNKFSKLFRMVLNNSDKDLVTIEEEKDVLELYLELEQMRFEQSFTYEILIEEDLEAEEIFLPSMLLQPYVENALWHGLMHKKGKRELLIEFRRINDDVFKCLIEDNGIGRKKSFEIKEHNSKAKRHKSKGLQIAKDRLDLLERQGQHASVDIIDKYDSEGAPTGTLVIIELTTFLNNS